MMDSTQSTQATSRTKRGAKAVAEVPQYDLVLAYDDGAGFAKLRALLPNSGEVLEFKFPALSDVNEFTDIEGDSGIEPMLIEEPHINGTGPVFSGGLIYSVGAAVMLQNTAKYDVSPQRYTTEGAKHRFHAALGKAMIWAGLETAVVHLTVGVNTERYEAMKNRIEAFYLGDHYFCFNGTRLRVEVARVKVSPQSIAAAHYIRNNMPTEGLIAEMLKEEPLTESVSLGIDVGNFNGNFYVLTPHPEIEGRLVATKYGSVDVGTQDVRTALETIVFAKTRQRPPLQVLDAAINPFHRHFGTVPNPATGKRMDISKDLAGIRASVWGNAFTQIRGSTRGAQPRYVFFIGGFGIVAADEIEATEIGVTPENETLTFGTLPGFYNARTEWGVVRGLAIIGAEDIASSRAS